MIISISPLTGSVTGVVFGGQNGAAHRYASCGHFTHMLKTLASVVILAHSEAAAAF